jgi:nicotinate-nucleotide adenylyltransferase
MVKFSSRLGVLGGTFDPIHFGHLDALDAARAALDLTETVVVPSHDPPHRQVEPRASAFHRFALVALAIDGRPNCRVSDLEVTREGPSYTIDTLRHLRRQGWQPSQIFFIIGTDAFAEISTWRAFPEVLSAANFGVVTRRGAPLDTARADAPEIMSVDEWRAQAPSTSAAVILHIEADTRDVSSTLIRSRLAARRPIDDLVPSAVARYIAVHHLYGAVDDLHGKNDTGSTTIPS